MILLNFSINKENYIPLNSPSLCRITLFQEYDWTCEIPQFYSVV